MKISGAFRWLVFTAMVLSASVARAREAEPSFFSSIVQMMEENRLELAEKELRSFLASTEHPAARDLLGLVLSRKSSFAEAEQQFQLAITAAPDFLEPRQHLARLYLLARKEGDAVRELRAAARLGELERDLAMKLAVVEMSAGDPAAAARQWRSLAERFDSVQALLYLAGTEVPQSALVTLRRALEIAPNSEEVLRAYARAAVSAQDFGAALAVLEPLVRMHESVAEYAYLMGLSRLKVGDTSGALEALHKARHLEPRRAATLLAIGLALNTQKRFPEAKDALVQSLRYEPDHLEALAALAEAEEGLSELAAAEEHVRRALAKDPRHGTANVVFGTLLMKKGLYEEARAAFEKAVAVDPESPKAHYQLSLAFARLGDRESSQRHRELYQQALRDQEASSRKLGASGEMPP